MVELLKAAKEQKIRKVKDPQLHADLHQPDSKAVASRTGKSDAWSARDRASAAALPGIVFGYWCLSLRRVGWRSRSRNGGQR